jgi:hypothetical protein
VCANDDAAGAGYEVPVAQPSGTGPAIDDQGWCPGNPPPASWPVHLTTLLFGGTFVWLWLTGGSWVVLLLLGIATVVTTLFSTLFVLGMEPLIRRELRRRSGMLQQQSWRAATVRVFSWGDGGKHLLLVDEGGENPLRLRTYGFDRVDEKMIMARTRRIWLVGPDAKGEYQYCVAGLSIPPAFAWVVDEQPPEDSEIMVEQAAPALLANAADDVVATWGLKRELNRRAFWWVLLVAGSILIGSVVLSGVLLSTGAEHAIESIAALGILLLVVVGPVLVLVPRLLCLFGRITRLRSTGPWTSVPVTMHDPVGPDKRRLRTYRGVATMPDRRTVSVGVHTMNLLAANIAATGLLWIVGEPTPGRAFAVGLPGYPYFGIGRFGR